jgi:hypothetical protein
VTIEDFKFVQSYLQAKQLYTMATPEEVETQIACLTFFSEIAKYGAPTLKKSETRRFLHFY